VPPRASTLRFPDGILKRAGVVSLQSKQEVVAEARRSLHPVKVAWVNVGDIDDTPTELNSRHAADYAADDALDELAASIREQGILQPLCVRPVGDRYGLVFGMRRLKAAVDGQLRCESDTCGTRPGGGVCLARCSDWKGANAPWPGQAGRSRIDRAWHQARGPGWARVPGGCLSGATGRKKGRNSEVRPLAAVGQAICNLGGRRRAGDWNWPHCS
jgi:hypothetical protein